MIIEYPIPPVIDFLGKNGLIWLLVLVVLSVLVFVTGLIVSIVRYGSIGKGANAFGRGAVDILEELFTYTFYLFPVAILLIVGLMSVQGVGGYFIGIKGAIVELLFLGNIENTLNGFCLFSLLFALVSFAINYVGWFFAVSRQHVAGGQGTFADVFAEVFSAWRRVWAIARLAIKESLLRRVLFIFLVFIVILMFAGWFINPDATDPTAVYLAFVLSMSTYLVLLLALFLSAFSLPNDIKSKTIYTIVTKPVRSSEIVLGRMLGFGIVGTVLLCGMALLSFLFVSFQLQHDHILTQKDLVAVKFTDEELANLQASGEPFVTHNGTTRIANGHRHNVTL
ncbi:MAG: hypothetical protein FWH27_18565, partial [Planctomycetaceae bacterium]|nr:hypothetical protein [Planctomycetaceae bacterium]